MSGSVVVAAVGLALGEALLVVAEVEALLIALVEAEALEAGLATLSSTPRSSIPLSSKP